MIRRGCKLSEGSIPANSSGSYKLRRHPAAQPLPFWIHVVQPISPDAITLALSPRWYAVKPQEDPRRQAPVEFVLWGVEVLLTSATGEEAQVLNCVLRRSGGEGISNFENFFSVALITLSVAFLGKKRKITTSISYVLDLYKLRARAFNHKIKVQDKLD